MKTSDNTRVDLTVSVKRASGVSAAEGLFIHCAYNSKRKWRHESRSTPDEASCSSLNRKGNAYAVYCNDINLNVPPAPLTEIFRSIP